MLKSHKEKAQQYDDLIDKIVANPNLSYTAMGQSFTKHDLEKLENLAEYHRKKAVEDTYGARAVSDVSRGDRP